MSTHWEHVLPPLAIDVSAPSGPLESTVPRMCLHRHSKRCVHVVSPIHALLIHGKGTVGRLDHREHCEVVDVNVPEDMLASERRSRKQVTLRGEGSTRQKLPSMCILQGRRCVLLSHHDSCDGHLDVARRATGIARRTSQITDEPRFEAAQRQVVSGLVPMITEPAVGQPRPDDLSLEALVVHLKEVKAIGDVSEIGPKRVAVLEQDSFQSRSIRQTRAMN